MIAQLARWRWSAVSAVVLIGLGAAGWMMRERLADALREHPYFVINRVVIHGADQSLTPDDLRAWIGLTDTTTVWEASPTRVRDRLEQHPFIAHASVRREFPGALEIVVRERRPLAIAVLGDLYYVDRGGVTFGPLRDDDPRDLPLITGLDAQAPEGTRNWMLRRALRLMRRFDEAPSLGTLSEIHFDQATGVLVFPSAPHVPVLLGWGSWAAKLDRAGRALSAWHGSTDRLARLDTRFHNQVVATVRAAPAPAVTAPAATAKRRGRGLKA
jgi:cell division septal protein FtsQ